MDQDTADLFEELRKRIDKLEESIKLDIPGMCEKAAQQLEPLLVSPTDSPRLYKECVARISAETEAIVLKSEYNRLDQRFENLSNEYDKLQEAHSDVTDFLNDMREEKEELAAENASLKQQLAEKDAELQSSFRVRQDYIRRLVLADEQSPEVPTVKVTRPDDSFYAIGDGTSFQNVGEMKVYHLFSRLHAEYGSRVLLEFVEATDGSEK